MFSPLKISFIITPENNLCSSAEFLLIFSLQNVHTTLHKHFRITLYIYQGHVDILPMLQWDHLLITLGELYIMLDKVAHMSICSGSNRIS